MKSAVALFALTLCAACNSARPPTPATQLQPVASEKAPTSTATDDGWQIKTSTNKIEGRPEVVLSKWAEDASGAFLVVRCSRGVTDAYILTPEIVDNTSVRVKFDQEPPRHQNWIEANSHDALFSRDAINLARKLTKTGTLLLEYKPFEKIPATLEFNLEGLSDHLNTVAVACNWAKIDAAKAQAERNAKAAAKHDRLRNAKIREALAKYVEPCREAWLREKGHWCWYDVKDSYFMNGGAPFETKEAALDDAVFMAKAGRVFVKQLAEIDRDLKP